jgi:hypothetical protein
MKVKDKGLARFKQALQELGKTKWRIGATGEHAGGISNHELLAIHEFGTSDKRIPARMPVRSVIRDKAKMGLVSKTLVKTIENAYGDNGKLSVAIVKDAVANSLKQLVQNGIRQGLKPALAESTLKRKQKLGYSSLPLIATGQLINSIEVEAK